MKEMNKLLETEIAIITKQKSASAQQRDLSIPISELKKDLEMYDFLTVLGKGTLGIVYEAVHKQLERKTAIKMLRPEFFKNRMVLDNFRSEAQIISSLKHENVSSVYDFTEVNGHYYLIMEMVSGGNLASVINNEDKKYLDEQNVIKIMFGLLEGLRYTHNKNIVHLDLKPSNILLDENGDPVIVDFGISIVKKRSDAINNSQIAGTPYYMSPEQYTTALNMVDFRSDIYSIGVIFYQLLANKLPHKGETFEGIRKKVLTEEPKKLTEINPAISKSLEAIVLKMMKKNPNQRYENAQAVIEDLRRYLKGEPVKALKYRTATKIISWMKRNKAISILSFIVFITIIGFSAYFNYKKIQETPQWIENVFSDDFNVDFSSRWSGYKGVLLEKRNPLKEIDVENFNKYFGNRINVVSLKKDFDLIVTPKHTFNENLKVNFKLTVNSLKDSNFGIFINAPMSKHNHDFKSFGYIVHFSDTKVFLKKHYIGNSPLFRGEFIFESDKIYNVTLSAVDGKIILLINDEKVIDFQDFIAQFSKKEYKIGFFSKQVDIEIDDVTVSELRSPFYSLPLDIGNRFFQFGWINKSIEEYSLVIAKYPDHKIALEAHYLRGLAYLSLGRHKNDKNAFHKALKDFNYLLTPETRENIKGRAYYQKGICNLFLNNYEQAFKSFNQAIHTYNISSLHSNISLSIVEFVRDLLNKPSIKDIQSARKIYFFLLGLDFASKSSYVDIPKKMINYYFDHNQPLEALKILNQLTKHHINDRNIMVYATYNSGRAYFELSRSLNENQKKKSFYYTKAIQSFKKVINNYYDKYIFNELSYSRLSSIYRLQGQFQKATEIEKLANQYMSRQKKLNSNF